MSANGMVRPCSCPANKRSWRGRRRQGARHVSESNYRNRYSRIDIGKNSFHVVGLDQRGAIVLRQKWSRGQVDARLPTCRRAWSAWKLVSVRTTSAGSLRRLVMNARLMPAKYVRPYSKGQKERLPRRGGDCRSGAAPDHEVRGDEDRRSARPAGTAPRAGAVGQPAHPASSIRSAPSCWSVALPVRQGQRFLRAELPRILATPPDVLSPRMVRLIEDWLATGAGSTSGSRGLSGEIEAVARQDADCERLMSVPGVGPIISSAMVAAIGRGDVFSKGRDFGAWLGLVPKQTSTGDRTILGKISKRGNRYLRVLFVQAAWVVLIKPKSWERHGLKPWIEAAKNGCTAMCWQLRSPTSWPASPGAFWPRPNFEARTNTNGNRPSCLIVHRRDEHRKMRSPR